MAALLESLPLAKEIRQAVKYGSSLCPREIFYAFIKTACAIEVYAKSSNNLNTVFKPPEPPFGFYDQQPETVTVREIFSSAINEFGILETIRSLEKQQSDFHSKSQQYKTLSAVIAVGKQTIAFISSQLNQTPECLSAPSLIDTNEERLLRRTRGGTANTHL